MERKDKASIVPFIITSSISNASSKAHKSLLLLVCQMDAAAKRDKAKNERPPKAESDEKSSDKLFSFVVSLCFDYRLIGSDKATLNF